jgi:hypothetical protein
MDSAFNDPRAHYIRHIFLRWIESPPKSSAELKNVIAIPLSQVPMLTSRTRKWRCADGTELELQLNHHTMVDLVLSMPMTQAFISSILQFHQATIGQPMTYGLGGAQVF